MDTFYENKKILKKMLENEEVSLNDKSIDYIASNFKHNRLLFKKEIEKIVLFLKNNQFINEKELRRIVKLEHDYDIDGLIYSVVSGKLKNYGKYYYNLKRNGTNNITIINALARHFYKILYCKEYFTKTKSYKQAIKLIFPPIFFQYEDEFIDQVKLWSKENIERILEKLLSLELEIKKNSKKSDLLTEFFLYSLTNTVNKL